jgi:hypothetical protein
MRVKITVEQEGQEWELTRENEEMMSFDGPLSLEGSITLLDRTYEALRAALVAQREEPK